MASGEITGVAEIGALDNATWSPDGSLLAGIFIDGIDLGQVVDYFAERGKRAYEDSVYSNLGEFYFDKRRYADASATYNAFVSRNPFHKKSPNFHMRVIEIHAAGGFPSLVLDAKKAFASTYGLKAGYWKYFDPADRAHATTYI